jgi:GntR family transcriptional regulator
MIRSFEVLGVLMPEPKWRQIAEDLRQKIESGQLGGSDEHERPKPLPTELELQGEYGASRNTVRDAIDWLRTRGLVYTRSGQGTFVAQKINPFVTRLSTNIDDARNARDDAIKTYASEVQASHREFGVSVPRIEIHQALGTLATELSLPEGASVVSRHQRRMIDDVPFSLQTAFYPMELVDRGAVRLIRAEDIEDGAVAYVGEKLGLKQAGWRDRIQVRTPDDNETAFFGLPDDGSIAVIEIRRTSYDEQGTPLRVTVSTYPADRNLFVMDLGKVPRHASLP